MTRLTCVAIAWLVFGSLVAGTQGREPDQVIPVWPNLAPGEQKDQRGEAWPRRENENPPATRIGNITTPTLHLFRAPQKAASAPVFLILPGGGYRYVVADKEGSEVADWLNSLGISAFVLHYRTQVADHKQSDSVLPAHSERPLQDAQRALSLIRSRAKELDIDSGRVGVIGFSAGGQLAALVTTRSGSRSYPPVDEVDTASCRPDVSLLMYPWQILKADRVELAEAFTVDETTPPTFLLHTDDDSSTSLGSIELYKSLKLKKIPAELHVFANGGHGYGIREVENSEVDGWPALAGAWLRKQNFSK